MEHQRMSPILYIGVGFSVVLSVVLLAVGVDESASVIIGLCATILSLLIELIARVAAMEQRVLDVSGLGRRLATDRELFTSISRLVNDYQRVAGEQRYRLFADRAQHIVAECAEGLHDLVEGHMTLQPLSEYSFGVRGIDGLRSSIKATSYVDAEKFWNSVAGEDYFQKNIELLGRGVQVTRVFIGDRSTMARFRAVVMRHRQARMRVLIALVDEIPKELCEDYLIGDDEILTQLQLTRDGQARAERISIEVNEVRRAVNNFDRLMRAAHEWEEIFPDAAAP
jgi:hypothetical protein